MQDKTNVLSSPKVMDKNCQFVQLKQQSMHH